MPDGPYGEWCDAPFGPMFTSPDGEVEPTFACRQREGHDGPHECRASRERGWVEPEMRPPATMTREDLEEWLSC